MGGRLATVLGSMVCAAACSTAGAEGLSPAEQEVAADPDGVYALETAATTADEIEPTVRTC